MAEILQDREQQSVKIYSGWGSDFNVDAQSVHENESLFMQTSRTENWVGVGVHLSGKIFMSIDFVLCGSFRLSNFSVAGWHTT